MSKKITYEEALDELREIARAIEEESVSVDELSQKVKRAAELVDLCQNRLRQTEKEVDAIVQAMGDENEEE